MKSSIHYASTMMILISFLFGAAEKGTAQLHVSSEDDTLRSKLGQLFIVGFTGPSVTDSVFADLSDRNIGGVILSYVNGNLESPSQIQQLISQIRAASRTPPFICADQEGGEVARLNQNDGFAPTYSAYTLGMVFKSIDSTRAEAAMMASWMDESGFNLDLAPVVDVAPSPYYSSMYNQRRFSTDPNVVAEHAQTFIDRFHAADIMTTLKHFPGGDGGSFTDLLPYQLLLDSSRVDMIMVTHEYDTQIDSVNLTSLSRAVVQGLLRDSLRYQGVVITDDLFQMETTDYYGYGQAAELALNAGDDILLYVGNTANGGSLVRQVIDTLEADVQQGKIPMARVDEAYNRILDLKARYHITSVHGPIAAARKVPDAFRLSNFPNPFNPSTTIDYDLPQSGHAAITVYDALGRQVQKLVDQQIEAGHYQVTFDASRLPSGIYFYRLQSGAFTRVNKMILIK